MNIAIIGAGLSGSNIYRLFKNDGHDVTIFEKSRGAGGRCSTRYINDKLIDHGTPFFETTNDEFKSFCDTKVKDDILVKKEDIYYPTNGMNKLCSSLIDDKDIVKNTKIVSCKRENNVWNLKDQNGISYNGFDKLIVTIPAPQILQLNIDTSNIIKEKLKKVKYNSIVSLLLYSHTLQNIMNPKLLSDVSIKKVIDNSPKYNYKNFSSYVIHLSEELSNSKNFTTKDEVKAFMLEKIYNISGIILEEDFYIIPHIWRYAFVSNSIDEEYIYDEKLSLGICGDFFRGDNLEGAYLSSKRLYEKEFK